MSNEKPSNVKKALLLIWVSLVISFLRKVVEQLNHAGPATVGQNVRLLFIGLIISALMVLLVYFIAKRKNWARWIYIFFTLFDISLSISSIFQNLAQRPFNGTLELVQMVAQLVACILLFTTPARAWFIYQSVDKVRTLKGPRNYIAIFLLVLFIVTLPMLGQLYLLAGILSIQAVQTAIFDGKSDFYSKEIGKEVHLVPFTVLTKMTNYGGWTDEYNYIFANTPSVDHQSRLNEYSVFKVIDEKTKTSILNPTHKICILENLKNKNQKASVYCNDIPHINEATKIITQLSNEIKANGKAFVATTADRRNSKLKSVLKLNSFIVFEINSDEELKELVAPNNDQNESYANIMHFTHLIPLKEAEVFNESAQSKIFLHHFGGHWSDEIYGYSSFESYIQNNVTPPDMEKWIMGNHPNPQDRWAIRSIIAIVQQAIIVEEKMDSYRATELVKGLEASKACVSKYYSANKNAKNEIDKALAKYFERGDRRAAFLRIKNKFDSKNGGSFDSCHNFFPPVICGGKEKWENWTR